MKLSRYLEVIKEQFNATDVNSAYSFKYNLGADSLDMVELLSALEDETGVDLPDTLADIDNVDKFYRKMSEALNLSRVSSRSVIC
jgi:acyl carrier protein